MTSSYHIVTITAALFAMTAHSLIAQPEYDDLSDAIWASDVSYVQGQLRKDHALANARDMNQHWEPGQYQYTMLEIASLRGNADIVRLLIDNGADVNAEDGSGTTAIHHAANAAVAQLLVEHGADVDKRTNLFSTPLFNAAHFARVDVARLLLQHGVDPNARDLWGRTPLHYAAASRSQEMVELLIEFGADPRAADFLGSTILHWAVENNIDSKHPNLEMARYLICNFIDVNTPEINRSTGIRGGTPLHWVSYGDVAALLIEYGADVNARATDGCTPLDYCFDDDMESTGDVARVLLEHGADVNARDAKGRTPLQYALKSGRIADLMVVFDHDPDVTARDSSGAPAIMYAEYPLKFYPLIASLLKQHHLDLNVRDTSGSTLLHYYVRSYSLPGINAMLSAGADVNVTDNAGRTPIFYAIEASYDVIVKTLCQNGAKLDVRDAKGRTPLACVRSILNASKGQKSSPDVIAYRTKYQAILSYLIKQGATE